MEMINSILQAREEKSNYIKEYIDDYQIVTLKANIVGSKKNIKESYILISYFDRLISEKCLNKKIVDNADGPYVIYFFDKSVNLKEEMVLLEEKEELGRLVDIDVYYNETTSLSRKKLRKCFLCDNPAFVCGRLKTHSEEELNSYIKKETLSFLLNKIKHFCDESIMGELNLHPKFGLVTPYTNGSHNDMDYDLMIKAKNAIIPFFVEMFAKSYDTENIDEAFNTVRKIGIQAEKAMYEATNGINAYKGLIFVLGLLVTSVAIKLSNLKKNLSCFDYIKQMTKGITSELANGNDTFGKLAYQEYKFKGARYEAEQGFPNVIKTYKQYNLDDDNSKIKALCNLISSIDDTVLLKRCKSIDYYNEVISKFKKLQFNDKDITQLNNYCIEHKLSFGGSADLLIASIFIKKIENTFDLNYMINN